MSKRIWLGLALLLSTAPLSSQAAPFTTTAHWSRFTHALFQWNSVALPLFATVISQSVTRPAGFANNPRGYAHHYGVDLLDAADSKLLVHFVFPAAFSQDENYIPIGPGNPWQERVEHALRHLAITESADQTRDEFNTTGVPAALAGAVISNLYQPRPQRTVVSTLDDFGWNVASYIAGDLYSEFKPELARYCRRCGFLQQ